MSARKNKETHKLVRKFLSGKINRRTFIITVAAFGGGFALSELIPALYRSLAKEKILSAAEAAVLSQVQLHLFPPADHSPGAQDINAFAYLQFVLADPALDPRDQKFIINGVRWLEEECQSLFLRSFTDLNPVEKETILRKIETENWGERWISQLLKYIFEALLTDPIYGGNPDKIGWKWLSHIPGEPRPNVANRYGAGS